MGYTAPPTHHRRIDAMPEMSPDALPDEHLIRLWDLPTRAYRSADRPAVAEPADPATLAGWLEYGVLVLVGWLGSPRTRFAGFLRPPSEVAAYVRAPLRGEHTIVVGHNPLGGWSVLLMLALSTLQAATMRPPPWRRTPSAAFALVHHLSFILLLVAVALHIGVVFLHIFVAEDDLVTPMLRGRKRVPSNMAAADREFASNGRALALLVVVAAALWVLMRP